MEYKRINHTVIARIDRGEEIVEELMKIAAREKITLASVHALGAIDRFTVGVFLPGDKSYRANEFCGCFEIVSLTGTVTEKEGEPYCHLHMSAGNEKGEVFGGHLNRAVVSATCEMVIEVLDGCVGRKFDEDVGLNLMAF